MIADEPDVVAFLDEHALRHERVVSVAITVGERRRGRQPTGRACTDEEAIVGELSRGVDTAGPQGDLDRAGGWGQLGHVSAPVKYQSAQSGRVEGSWAIDGSAGGGSRMVWYSVPLASASAIAS